MLKIRLRRMGKTHAPHYRVVVSDSRRTPTASAVEEVGHYNPRPTPPDIRLNVERVHYWREQGALLSPTVKKLLHRVEHGDLAEVAVVPGAEAPGAQETATEKKAEAAGKTEPKQEAEAKAAPETKAEAATETAAESAADDSEE